ncbi:ROK family transcriptional regulator [Terrarubrum flagellatum]|uniref:ROK family transcriptional regulator n=1 Tax=Terrirubrum flagellatum TaxID=2895980 RepID=UPI00314509EF
MALFGTNLEHGQRYNRRVVLEAIRLHGPLSRAEIARRTGLSAQTISNIMEVLKREHLVTERARRSGSRGQPPINIEIDPAGAYSFGVSFDHSRLSVILLDLGGAIRGEVVLPVIEATPDVLVPLIESAAQALLGRHAAPRERVWGLGLVLPALVRNGDPTALGPLPGPNWQEFPVADRLQERLSLPVLVDNDATAGAIGEMLYGAGKALRSFFYFYLGVGLGGGIVMDGRPGRGASGMAGEVAHLISVPGGLPCACGNSGCLERYVSLSAAQSALTGEPEGARAVDVAALAAAYAAKNPRLTAWISAAGIHLRNAIVSVENLLDPEAVIVGGLMPEPLLDALLAAIEPLPPSVSSRHNPQGRRLVKAQAGLNTRVLGAAALVMFDTMTPDFARLRRQEHTEPEPIRLADAS